MFQAFRNIKIGVFIAFVNLLIQGISFFVQNFIARNLGTASYGHFGLLQTDYSIFCAIADFGMTTLILAFFGSRATVGSLFRNILQLRLFAAMGAALLMIAFACICLPARVFRLVLHLRQILEKALRLETTAYDFIFHRHGDYAALFQSR